MFGTAKGGSWATVIPLILSSGMAIWGTIRGAVLWSSKSVSIGAFGGALAGVVIGWIGYSCFFTVGGLSDGIAVQNTPVLWNVVTIFTTGGLAAGLITGIVSGLIETTLIANHAQRPWEQGDSSRK
jgi:hypothetical protein